MLLQLTPTIQIWAHKQLKAEEYEDQFVLLGIDFWTFNIKPKFPKSLPKEYQKWQYQSQWRRTHRRGIYLFIYLFRAKYTLNVEQIVKIYQITDFYE